MASATTSPPALPDPFDLGAHTPANLNRGARTALLQNSLAVVNGPACVSPAPRRTRLCSCSHGRSPACLYPTSPDPARTTDRQPISIIESANRLAHECVEEYNAKLRVLKAMPLWIA
ncbi:hypothetical protein AUP68_13922 [Ilyonectria robusta]